MMGALEHMTISIPADMAAALREEAEAGDYASANDIVREAVRDWIRSRTQDRMDMPALRDAVVEGMDSGPGRPGDEVFADLRSRYIGD